MIPKKQLHLKNDIVFKAIYGRDTPTSKRLLIHLLNLILERKDDPIVDLEYKNPFHIGTCVGEKESILDIKVVTDSHELIDIELQLISRDYFINRILYYHGGTIRESLKKGQSYDKMLKTITICIVDDILFPGTDDFLSIFELREKARHFQLTDRSSIHFLELPKVNLSRKAAEKLSELELHLEYLKYAGEEETEYLRQLLTCGGKELQMTQYVLEKTTEDEILRERALAHEKWQMDMDDYNIRMREYKQRTQEYEQKTKDFEQKTKDYEQKTKDYERQVLQTAKAMKNDGICSNKIMQYTGLSIEKIQSL